jgi:hypothetical protein
MFKRTEGDRRRTNSFAGHLRRVLAKKGMARVALSLGGTAVIAAIAFAHCNSSSITGPSGSKFSTPGPAAKPVNGPSRDLGAPAKTSNHLPMPMLPDQNPCTGQVILWDPTQSFTNIQTTTQSGLDGQLHAQFHLNSQAQGATDPVRNPPAVPTLQYVGSQEQNSQDMVFATGNERYKMEWTIKVIAKGNDGTIFDDDDFFLHVMMDSPLDVAQATLTANTYCR